METHTKTTETCRAMRPRYFRDQLLTADIMTAEQDYHRHRSWQLHRSLLGTGVVHGLEVGQAIEQRDTHCLQVGPGLAIDCWGRIIEIGPEGARVCLEETICPGDPVPDPGVYTLRVHYAERAWPVLPDPHCPPHDQNASWICSGVRFSLKKGCEECDPCACPEVECCVDACSYVCMRQGSVGGQVWPDSDLEHAMACPPPLEEGPDGWLWDLSAGVPLACVEVCDPYDQKQCDGDLVLRPTEHDPCSVRRHVYRNRQLFELVRECHLERPRLEPPPWLPDWDGVALPVMSWSDFAEQCNDPQGGFPLRFTRPLLADGVHEASIMVEAIVPERQTDYYEARRVPLAEIIKWDSTEYAGSSFVRGVRLRATGDWLQAEINGKRSTLFDEQGILIELTLRGAMLRDHCGTMLDARPPGAANGPEHVRNGDDLVIAFRVEPHPKASA